jgi:uncharacterized membrane protein YfcA
MIFLAGFVDAIAGGGGLISLPALLLAGLPAHYAIGTHKTAMSIGTFIAAGKYIRAKKADLRVGFISAAGSAIGALGGSTLALRTSDSLLRILMLAILPLVAVFLLVKRDFGKQAGEEKSMSPQRLSVTAFLIGLLIGGYDGLIGPGTGTFFILAFTALMGFDLLKSSGCAKIANLASNVTALFVFALSGKVLVALTIPAPFARWPEITPGKAGDIGWQQICAVRNVSRHRLLFVRWP